MGRRGPKKESRYFRSESRQHFPPINGDSSVFMAYPIFSRNETQQLTPMNSTFQAVILTIHVIYGILLEKVMIDKRNKSKINLMYRPSKGQIEISDRNFWNRIPIQSSSRMDILMAPTFTERT